MQCNLQNVVCDKIPITDIRESIGKVVYCFSFLLFEICVIKFLAKFRSNWIPGTRQKDKHLLIHIDLPVVNTLVSLFRKKARKIANPK